MTTQTPATAKIEKWLRFFPKFWLRIRRKNAESCRSRLRLSGSGPTSGRNAVQAIPNMLLSSSKFKYIKRNKL